MLFKISNRIINAKNKYDIVKYLQKQNGNCEKEKLFKLYQERLGIEAQPITEKRFIQLIFWYENIQQVFRLYIDSALNVADIFEINKKIIYETDKQYEGREFKTIITDKQDFERLKSLNPEKIPVYDRTEKGYFFESKEEISCA